ncbi:MAG: O-methyltransferase [Vampirovibrionia bacterium]
MNSTIESKLKELEKTRKDFWNVSPELGKLLYIMAKTKQAKNILELGTSNGYSTIWLALAAQELKTTVTTIEYHQCRVDLANENFTQCGLTDYIKSFQGKIIPFLEETKEQYDFIFIDACKYEYIEYFKILENKIPQGSIIISDNITSHKESVQDYIDYSSSLNAFKTVFIPMDEGILINYKL